VAKIIQGAKKVSWSGAVDDGDTLPMLSIGATV